MERRKILKRLAALLITLAFVILTNIAISYASGIPQLPDGPRPVTVETANSQLLDLPRP